MLVHEVKGKPHNFEAYLRELLNLTYKTSLQHINFKTTLQTLFTVHFTVPLIMPDDFPLTTSGLATESNALSCKCGRLKADTTHEWLCTVYNMYVVSEPIWLGRRGGNNSLPLSLGSPNCRTIHPWFWPLTLYVMFPGDDGPVPLYGRIPWS